MTWNRVSSRIDALVQAAHLSKQGKRAAIFVSNEEQEKKTREALEFMEADFEQIEIRVLGIRHAEENITHRL